MAPVLFVEEVRRIGLRMEEGNIPLPEGPQLAGDHARDVLALLQLGPHAQEVALALQRIALQVRVVGLAGENAVDPGVAEDEPDVVTREEADGTVLGQQRLPVLQEEPVHHREPLDDLLRVVRRDRASSPERGDVLAPAHARLHAVDARLVRHGHVHIRRLEGRLLALHVVEATHEVGAIALARHVDGGKERGAQHRIVHGAPDGFVELGVADGAKDGVEEGLQIDEDRVLARGDQVLICMSVASMAYSTASRLPWRR